MEITAETLDEAVAKHAFTGVLTVDVGSRRILERSEGFSHRALAVANTPATRFAIGSGSKGFTALGVMRLVEEGVLRLDKPVRTLLGDDLPLIDDAVTVEHLLTHTSGIGDYLDEEADWEAEDYVLPVPVHTLATAEDFVPIVDGFPQKFPPGEKFSYCNGGYIVLAVIIERAQGRIFQDFIESEVCDRAGLTKTRFLRSDDLPGDAALGYLFDSGNRTNVLHLPVRGNGDGGIYTTADELLAFWVSALRRPHRLPAESLAEMIRPRSDVPEEDMRYGMGLPARHQPGVMLEGYDAGVSFRTLHDPATATTVSVLGNSSEGAWPVIFTLKDAIDAG